LIQISLCPAFANFSDLQKRLGRRQRLLFKIVAQVSLAFLLMTSCENICGKMLQTMIAEYFLKRSPFVIYNYLRSINCVATFLTLSSRAREKTAFMGPIAFTPSS
jgi:hypothetical protein